MMVSFLQILGEEIAWGKVEEGIKANLPPLISELDKQGVLTLWLKLGKNGGSVWKSALMPKMKRGIKEALTGNAMVGRMMAEDPGRVVAIAIGSLPPKTAKKILTATPETYWIDQVREALRAAGIEVG